MSHRKRVRAYWNKRAAEKRHAELFAALNGFFKAKYSAVAPIMPDHSVIRGLLPAGLR